MCVTDPNRLICPVSSMLLLLYIFGSLICISAFCIVLKSCRVLCPHPKSDVNALYSVSTSYSPYSLPVLMLETLITSEPFSVYVPPSYRPTIPAILLFSLSGMIDAPSRAIRPFTDL